MERRKFFSLAGCALATILFGKFELPTSDKSLRPVFVLRNKVWQRVRLHEICKGETFKMYVDKDYYVCVASEDPHFDTKAGCFGIVGIITKGEADV